MQDIQSSIAAAPAPLAPTPALAGVNPPVAAAGAGAGEKAANPAQNPAKSDDTGKTDDKDGKEKIRLRREYASKKANHEFLLKSKAGANIQSKVVFYCAFLAIAENLLNCLKTNSVQNKYEINIILGDYWQHRSFHPSVEKETAQFEKKFKQELIEFEIAVIKASIERLAKNNDPLTKVNVARKKDRLGCLIMEQTILTGINVVVKPKQQSALVAAAGLTGAASRAKQPIVPKGSTAKLVAIPEGSILKPPNCG